MGVQIASCVVVIDAQLAVCVSSIFSHKNREVNELVATTVSFILLTYVPCALTTSTALTDSTTFERYVASTDTESKAAIDSNKVVGIIIISV
jgi:hypothetical protein